MHRRYCPPLSPRVITLPITVRQVPILVAQQQHYPAVPIPVVRSLVVAIAAAIGITDRRTPRHYIRPPPVLLTQLRNHPLPVQVTPPPRPTLPRVTDISMLPRCRLSPARPQ